MTHCFFIMSATNNAARCLQRQQWANKSVINQIRNNYFFLTTLLLEQRLNERRHMCQSSDGDILVWNNNRFIQWIKSIDLKGCSLFSCYWCTMWRPMLHFMFGFLEGNLALIICFTVPLVWHLNCTFCFIFVRLFCCKLGIRCFYWTITWFPVNNILNMYSFISNQNGSILQWTEYRQLSWDYSPPKLTQEQTCIYFKSLS